MQVQLFAIAVVVALTFPNPTTAQHPETSISNDRIKARIYLPDIDAGYYRGTRFDWSGVIHSLVHDGHEYFGEWQKSDDPHLHDRITGPVDSFETDTDVKAGQSFLRVGVGVCEKPAEPLVNWKHPFRVINHGEWKTTQGVNWIQMTQTLDDADTNFAYRYTKRLTLIPNSSDLVIDHVLINTGQKAITSEVYNHNFFVIDDQPTGPDFVLRFPFSPTADRDLKQIGKLEGRQLKYQKTIPQGEHIFTLLSGYDSHADDNRFTIENHKTKAGVRVSMDRKIDKLQFWSPRTTICPEPFINLKLASGQSDRWAIRYSFYTLPK